MELPTNIHFEGLDPAAGDSEASDSSSEGIDPYADESDSVSDGIDPEAGAAGAYSNTPDTSDSDAASVNTDSGPNDLESSSLESNLELDLETKSNLNKAMDSGLPSQSNSYPDSQQPSVAQPLVDGEFKPAHITQAICASFISELEHLRDQWWPAYLKLHRINLNQADLLNFIVINNEHRKTQKAILAYLSLNPVKFNHNH
ncbi:hypothetical protein DFH28DRAFT_1131414 [Melampsora americana]|nr:hypothetical protein DFH28DRAFT_1131414 [Melampsora americana]